MTPWPSLPTDSRGRGRPGRMVHVVEMGAGTAALPGIRNVINSFSRSATQAVMPAIGGDTAILLTCNYY
jgi:hypothetical protein